MMSGIATFVINASWQVTLLAAIAFGLTRWRSFSASERHRIWAMTFLLCFLVPLSTILRPLAPSAPAGELNVAEGSPVPVATTAGHPAKDDAVSLGVSREAAMALSALYVAFVVAGLLRLVRGARRAARLRASASIHGLPEGLEVVEARCRRVLGVDRGRILWSSGEGSPVTFGLLDPVILLPARLRNEASSHLFTAIMGHELAHIRRHDYPWNVAFELLRVAIGIHPVAHWIKRQLDRTREEACDEAVAVELLEPRAYARCLVAAAAMFLDSGPSHSLGVLGTHSLEGRIMYLTKLGTRRPARRAALSFAGTALVATSVFSSTFAVTLIPTPSDAREQPVRRTESSREVREESNDEERGAYRAAGRRDPFIGPQSVPQEEPEGPLGFEVGSVTLHGIVKTTGGSTAMLVGPDDKTYFVREGQPFGNGVLAKIGNASVTFRVRDPNPLSALADRDLEVRLHTE
ncbi:MAG TPA: M56 family metallopeptidase [Vicinamibacteria bacterium]|nr:M56 family metallopeptidase [Vicinamibacteria bacterium]